MLKSKTLWASVTAVLTSVGGYFTGDLELSAMLQIVVTSTLAVCLRHGVKMVEEAAR